MASKVYKSIGLHGEQLKSFRLRIMNQIENIDDFISESAKSGHDRSARFEIYKEAGLFNAPNIVCEVLYEQSPGSVAPNIFLDNGLLLLGCNLNAAGKTEGFWNGYVYGTDSLHDLENDGFISTKEKNAMAAARRTLEAVRGNGIANLNAKTSNNFLPQARQAYDRYLCTKYGSGSAEHSHYMSLARKATS